MSVSLAGAGAVLRTSASPGNQHRIGYASGEILIAAGGLVLALRSR